VRVTIALWNDQVGEHPANCFDAATALAARRGVRDVPAVRIPDGEVFHGDEALARASRTLGG